jgi:hypothetical protein
MSGRPSAATAGNAEVSGMGQPVGPETTTTPKITRASLRTPRAAAFAGIAFSLILGTALVLVRVAVPTDPAANSAWLEDGWRKDTVLIALSLVPFAGLAFLWFIGVVRDRIGAAEDRLFATVFLGTGLLFVAMLFVSAATAAGLLEAEAGSSSSISPEVWSFARHTTYLVLTVYAMRMAGIFVLVTTTIMRRTRILPRWLVAIGFLVAIVLLLTVESIAWAVLLFPVWVLLLSLHFLVHPPARPAPDDVASSPA